MQRLKHWLLYWRQALLALAIILVYWIPHLFYQHYAFGEWQLWTYADEGFTNWKSPQILKLWFSPMHGLFTYAPLMFIVVIGMIWSQLCKACNAWLYLTVFLLVSYLCASWWNVSFGSSYGSRSFVEYYALLVFPLAWLMRQVGSLNWRGWTVFMGILVVIAIVINLQVIYHYDERYFGGVWDFTLYWKYWE